MASTTSTSTSTSTSAGAGPAPGLSQAHAEWAAASMQQAYYAAGGQPYAYAAQQQHLMAPYGGTFHPHPAYYTHASMATVNAGPRSYGPTAEPAAAAEGKSKSKRKTSSGGCTSGRLLLYAARKLIKHSSAGGSQDESSSSSSDKRDASSARHKVLLLLPSVKRRKSSGANVDDVVQGEPSSQAATAQDAAAESRIRITAEKRPAAAKLSVSLTPEMAAASNVRPNLNIGMELWSDSPVIIKAETSGQGEINAALPSHSQHDSAVSMMDERELKRERRKQSNRESARRSRLRKQQECEELAHKVTDLTAINGTLRSELDELKKACEDMEAENSQLMGELEQSEAPSVVTTLSIQIDTSKAHHRSSGQHDNRNTDSKG